MLYHFIAKRRQRARKRPKKMQADNMVPACKGGELMTGRGTKTPKVRNLHVAIGVVSLRELGSNQRPAGYGPAELPLLYPAIKAAPPSRLPPSSLQPIMKAMQR